jgi:hypothetical protein
MTLTYMAILLMAALRDGARRYYVPSPGPRARPVTWFAKTSIDQLLQVDRNRPVEVNELVVPLTDDATNEASGIG